MSEKHFIIIGNGPGGKEAAFTLRKKAPHSRITIIDKGIGTSYLPQKLPELISGKIEKEDLHTCAIDLYRDKDIKLRCGQRVVALDSSRRELILGHKEVISFDGLIIAAGGRVRVPERLLSYNEYFYTLKTLQDAKRWTDRLPDVDSVLVIGGDLISLDVVKVLRHLGKKVYFVINSCAFWPLRYNEEMAEDVCRKLTELGVIVITGEYLKEVEQQSDGSYKVRVDGQTLEVGMIGAFYGLQPDVDFLANSGLRVDRGILVDEHLSTGVPGIYAVGDCAQIYHPQLNDYWISLGHDNAALLGRTAAINLASGTMKEEITPKSIFKVQGVNIDSSWTLDF